MFFLKALWIAIKQALGYKLPSLFVEFKVVNQKLMRMGGGDIAKQVAERSAYLDSIREQAIQRERAGLPNIENSNPFPEWLENLIHRVAGSYGAVPEYQDENAIVAMKLYGDRKTFNQFCTEFSTAYERERKVTSERLSWSNDHTVHPTATPDNEVDALNELDAHHGGVQSQVAKDKKKDLQTAS